MSLPDSVLVKNSMGQEYCWFTVNHRLISYSFRSAHLCVSFSVAEKISRASTRSNSGMHSCSSEIHTSTSVSGVEDEDQHHSSEWSQTATSCESASDPDGKESSCSTANYTESESESQPREPQSTRTKLQGGLSPNVLEDRAEDAKRRVAAHGQNVGMLAYPGTPLRSFPGWQPYAGSPPVGSNLILGSPRTDKGTGSYSPASLSGIFNILDCLVFPCQIIVSGAHCS